VFRRRKQAHAAASPGAFVHRSHRAGQEKGAPRQLDWASAPATAVEAARLPNSNARSHCRVQSASVWDRLSTISPETETDSPEATGGRRTARSPLLRATPDPGRPRSGPALHIGTRSALVARPTAGRMHAPTSSVRWGAAPHRPSGRSLAGAPSRWWQAGCCWFLRRWCRSSSRGSTSPPGTPW